MLGRRWVGWLAAAFMLVLAFEMTARIEDRIRYGMPVGSPNRSEADLVVRDSLGMHGRPGASFLKWRMNSLGFRGPEVARRRPGGTLRIVATGASEMFGQSESPEQEFPRQLEDSLRARLAEWPNAPYDRVEVLNAAFFGMSLPTTIQDVQLRIRQVEPHMVVLYPTTAQYLSEDIPGAAEPLHGQVAEANGWQTLQPRSLTRLREQLKRLTPRALHEWRWRREYELAGNGRGAGWRFTTIPADRLAAFERDLAAFVGVVRATGATPVLSTHANRYVGGTAADSSLLAAWQRFYPRAEGRVILQFDSAGALATLRIASDSMVPVADIRDALAGCEPCFADYSHFTDQGAGVAAGRMADVVIDAARRSAIPQPVHAAVPAPAAGP